jgi:predicted signal transduction protein with EAL and GGDEF domain
LKQPFHIEEFEIFTSASIGVGIYPEHGMNYEALRRSADNAMYRAKHASKGDAVYFDANMGLAVSARMEIEQRLRLAVRDRRFCLNRRSTSKAGCCGFETLVRWRDDDGGFIRRATSSGLR